ncbi:flavodoxin family protein [Parabacteroides sp. 52]|uniref:flavodoxin family protein n=1 Tax=unclassified Parabacteroides TaxID=2649774 RepID=UPI0013D3CFD5|nr:MULTISPECIES: flavodoxin family protein [unclassified Parabacteroides]MDH6534565.1 multimeric flavodoxin WrbA [Parabacteroides sp. PM5-20]NDV55200.1 flavodoxin family protein [Parabacteroides sp. 52]
MSKKVLIVSASPRKGGNSDTLCDEFARGAREAGHEVEKIFFRDHKINYCLGCGVCNTTHKCVQKDDMAEVLDKMLAADVLVFGTPVYFYTMDAQLKTLIDRTVPRYTELKGKAYLIATLADKGEETMIGTKAAFQGFIDCLDNVEYAGTIVGYGVWNKGEIVGNPAVEEAYEAGKNL